MAAVSAARFGWLTSVTVASAAVMYSATPVYTLVKLIPGVDASRSTTGGASFNEPAPTNTVGSSTVPLWPAWPGVAFCGAAPPAPPPPATALPEIKVALSVTAPPLT